MADETRHRDRTLTEEQQLCFRCPLPDCYPYRRECLVRQHRAEQSRRRYERRFPIREESHD